MTYISESTRKIPEQNRKKLFFYFHSGSKHISQLHKALSNLNREFLMYPLNCTRITRHINNIMFRMWYVFFVIWEKKSWRIFSGLLLKVFFIQIIPSLEQQGLIILAHLGFLQLQAIDSFAGDKFSLINILVLPSKSYFALSMLSNFFLLIRAFLVYLQLNSLMIVFWTYFCQINQSCGKPWQLVVQ